MFTHLSLASILCKQEWKKKAVGWGAFASVFIRLALIILTLNITWITRHRLIFRVISGTRRHGGQLNSRLGTWTRLQRICRYGTAKQWSLYTPIITITHTFLMSTIWNICRLLYHKHKVGWKCNDTMLQQSQRPYLDHYSNPVNVENGLKVFVWLTMTILPDIGQYE